MSCLMVCSSLPCHSMQLSTICLSSRISSWIRAISLLNSCTASLSCHVGGERCSLRESRDFVDVARCDNAGGRGGEGVPETTRQNQLAPNFGAQQHFVPNPMDDDSQYLQQNLPRKSNSELADGVRMTKSTCSSYHRSRLRGKWRLFSCEETDYSQSAIWGFQKFSTAESHNPIS